MIPPSRERISQAQQSMQNVGVKVLMVFLFVYFTFAGASELGIAENFPPRFPGPAWLGKVMGMMELFGGLALLRPEGILGGAILLSVVMGCAVTLNVVHLQTEAALESLLMLAICISLAYWRRPDEWKTDNHRK